MNHGKDLDEGFNGSGRVDNDCRLHAVVCDELKGPVEMAAGFLVDADHVRACGGEVRDEGVGVLDHEVAVERQFGDRPDGFDDRRPEADVRDEVAVHDIDVDDGAAATLSRGDLVSEMREVRGEDREGEVNHDEASLPAGLAGGQGWTARLIRFGRKKARQETGIGCMLLLCMGPSCLPGSDWISGRRLMMFCRWAISCGMSGFALLAMGCGGSGSASSGGGDDDRLGQRQCGCGKGACT